MTEDRITKQVTGINAIYEVRELIKAFDRLGFEIEEVEITGAWRVSGAVVQLGPNIVGLPRKLFELAPGVFAGPTEHSVVTVVGARQSNRVMARDLYENGDPGHRIDFDKTEEEW